MLGPLAGGRAGSNFGSGRGGFGVGWARGRAGLLHAGSGRAGSGSGRARVGPGFGPPKLPEAQKPQSRELPNNPETHRKRSRNLTQSYSRLEPVYSPFHSPFYSPIHSCQHLATPVLEKKRKIIFNFRSIHAPNASRSGLGYRMGYRMGYIRALMGYGMVCEVAFQRVCLEETALGGRAGASGRVRLRAGSDGPGRGRAGLGSGRVGPGQASVGLGWVKLRVGSILCLAHTVPRSPIK